MDSMTGAVASLAMSENRQLFGAQVVSKTLDYMNSGNSFGGNSASADYDFQTSVLGAAYGGSGVILDRIA